MSTLATAARVLHALVLAVWMGGAVAFLVLERRLEPLLGSAHQAELVLREARALLDGFGLLAGPVLLLSLVAGWAPLQAPLRNRGLLVVLQTVLAGISARYLVPRQTALMAGLGRRLEDVPSTDPQLLELLQLHQIGVGVTAVEAALAGLLLATAFTRARPARRFGIEL